LTVVGEEGENELVTQQKPKILGLYDGLDNGCSYYRLISPFAQLAQMGRVYDWLSLADEKDIENGKNQAVGANYEMVSLLRPIVVEDGKQDQPVDEDNLGLIQAMIDRVHGAGALFGGDLDDDMWAVESHNPAHKAMGPHTADRIKRTLKGMDFVTCSTPFLAQRIIEICGIAPERVAVVPNMIDFDLYDRADWLLDAPGKPGEKVQVSMQDVRRRRLTAQGPDTRPVVIGIQGGLSHIEDWRQVAPSLKRIAEKYGERVRFVVAGGNFDYLKDALKEATEAGLVWWKGWTPFLEHSETVMQFDINLCPLNDTLFNRSKSAIKYLEASAAGAASVVSPTVYEEYVQPGLTGLIAREPGDWFEAISVLLDRPELRREIARNAHLVARSNFSLSANAYLWHNAYSDFYTRYGGKIKDNLVDLAELKEMHEMEEYRKAHQERLLEMAAS
jgi:glycosyltransferase involved in cell wall biosynthesis